VERTVLLRTVHNEGTNVTTDSWIVKVKRKCKES